MEHKIDILLFISSLGGGGAERVVANMASWWASSGYSVGLVTLSSADDDAYYLHPDVQRIALNLNSVSSGLVSATLANWRRVSAVRQVLTIHQPRVAIGFLTEVNVTLLIAARKLDIRVIVSERNYPPAESINFQWSFLRRIFYSSASVVMAQTTKAADWLRDNTSARKIEVMPNPVVWPIPSAQPVCPPADHVPSDARLIVAAGRLHRQKGFDLLIEAFSKLATSYPEWRLVIIGDGNEHQTLVTQIEEAGLQDQVKLIGRVGNVSDWYERCQLFVLSSRFEGFPNVLLEAMAAGCAVLSTDCAAGPSDLVEHGVNGYLVATDDSNSLSCGLERLMSDDAYRLELSSRAAEVQQKFSETEVMARWSDIAALPEQSAIHDCPTINRS